VVLTLTSSTMSAGPGATATKRVQGSFKGRVAHGTVDTPMTPRVVGPVKAIEGEFDKFTILR